MTFITGPSLAPKNAPLINGKSPADHVIQMRIVPRATECRIPKRAIGPPLIILTILMFVVLLGAGLLISMAPTLTTTTVHRYQGFCTIPIKDLPEDPAFYEPPSYKVMPLRWSAEPDVQVFSAADEDASDDVVESLREHFDIGESVEKISVVDNGRHVNFIHDFEANVSGIVDSDRCFMMELDPALVLSPEVLVLSIEGGAEFDVTRVRSTLRAALPALAQLAAVARDLAERCRDKPTYRLLKEDGLIIRKREVDAPSHDYIQFAGRRVQEIDISNLADILQHEQDNKLA